MNNNWRIRNVLNIRVALQQMMINVHMKLNPEVPWHKQHSTERKLSTPTNWT
jgi:hypothetical protein